MYRKALTMACPHCGGPRPPVRRSPWRLRGIRDFIVVGLWVVALVCGAVLYFSWTAQTKRYGISPEGASATAEHRQLEIEIRGRLWRNARNDAAVGGAVAGAVWFGIGVAVWYRRQRKPLTRRFVRKQA